MSWINSVGEFMRGLYSGGTTVRVQRISESHYYNSDRYSDLLSLPPVKAGVTFIAETVAQLQFKALGAHPEASALAQQLNTFPKQYYTKQEFIHRIVSDMLVEGNAFVVTDNLTQEFNHLPFGKVKVVNQQEEVYPFKQDRAYVPFDATPLDAREILHFELNNYKGEAIGLRNGHQTLIQTTRKLYEHQLNIAAQTPASIISLRKDFTGRPPAVKDEAKKAFLEDVQKGGVVISEMDVAYNKITGMTPEQSLAEAIKAISQDFFRILNIPPIFMGFADVGSKLTLEAQTQQLIQSCISPIARRIGEELTSKLLTMQGLPGEIILETDSVRVIDRKTQVDTLVALVAGGILAPDNAREVLGFPLLGEGYDKPKQNLATTDGLTAKNYLDNKNTKAL